MGTPYEYSHGSHPGVYHRKYTICHCGKFPGQFFPHHWVNLSPTSWVKLFCFLCRTSKPNSSAGDYRVNAQIFWITDGYKDSSREGLLRVHVQGKKSYVLKKEKYELAWTVRYATHSNPKFGVESIDLFPGVPNEICFGTLYDGCSFDPIHSIKAAGISAREICERSKSQQKIIGYQLSHPNRQGTLARWEEGWGSGGKESSFKLVFSVSSANLCND